MTTRAKQLSGLLPALVLACFALAAAPALALPSHFGEEGSGAGQISGETAGIAVDQESGDVYIADRNNQRVEEFGLEGIFIRAWGWGVADETTDALQTCTTACFEGLPGTGAGQFGVSTQNGPEGIAVDNAPGASHGDVFVGDPQNNRVQEFGPNGEFLLMLGGEVNKTTKGDLCTEADLEAHDVCGAGVPGKGAGEFESLTERSIAVDAVGDIYVGDRERIQRFSPDGMVEAGAQVSLPLASGFVEDLAVDSSNDLYVKSSELPGVRKYEALGKELPAPRDEANEIERSAIAIGPANELLVNDFQSERHHILAFTAEGVQTASFDAGGKAKDGRRGIAYSEKLKAIYVLNPGTVRVVTPPPPGPLVLEGSEAASEIQPTTATLAATVNPEGTEPATYRFEYGTTTAYGTNVPDPDGELTPGFTDQPVSVALTGLQPRTLYHFRVVSINKCEKEPEAHLGVKVECVTDGPDETFTTLPPVSIDATSVAEVNDKSARLEAALNPHGLASEYRFEYDTTPYAEREGEHGTKVPIPNGSVGAGTTDTAVGDLIQGLAPSTTYYYRVVAINSLSGPEGVVGPDHSFTTQGAVTSVLPDGRSWELVSPPNKHGSPLEPLTEEGGMIQAAAKGGGFAYISLGPINGEPAGVRSPHDSQLLATRGPEGWSTQDITTPHEEISIIRPGFPSEYKFFGDELQSSVVEPQGSTPLSPQTSERTPYRREANGEFAPLVNAGNVPAGTKFGGVEPNDGTGEFSNGVVFVTATPDLSRIVLASPQSLAPGFEPGFEPSNRENLYELASGSLSLVSVLPDGKPASESGLTSSVGSDGLNTRGAISDDGERVVFETSSEEHLYVRDLALAQTVQVNAIQPGAAGGTGVATFQVANGDDSKVLFTDTSRLTKDATAQPGKPDLYMCEVLVVGGHLTCTLSDLSVDHNLGEAADVRAKVSAIDRNGEHVYFAANGVLTNTPNAAGERAQPGDCESGEEATTCNLYEYDTVTKATRLVVVLSSADSPDWGGHGNLRVLGNLTARSSPDGHYFSFMSERSLTGYDNHDLHSNQLDEEVFLFDAESGTVSCVSCNPTGARPNGVFDKDAFPGLLVDHPDTWRNHWLAGSIPGWTLGPSLETALYQSRYLSNSGRMFFNAADALVPQDTNSVMDVYEYEPPQGEGQPASNSCTTTSPTYSATSGGCVNLISSGTSKEESAFLDASEDGSEAFFLTSSRLLGSDVDSAFDVYDAHVCSAESPCPPPPPPLLPACQGDACQNPVAAPNDATPGSLTFHGPGNQTQAAAVKAKAKPLTRAQKLAAALKSCKKKNKAKTKQAKARRAKCEKTARKSFGLLKRSKKKGK